MSPQAQTGWFILAAILAITAYDLFVWWYFGEAATISAVTRAAGKRWPLLAPLLAFAAGAIYGHLFL